MFETNVTIVGTVISDPIHRLTSSGEEVVNFRVASNARRRDGNGDWVDNGTLYAGVSCWRRLVPGVAASLAKGDPVIVMGQLRTTSYTSKDGQERTDSELRASAVGPDLSRCQVRIDRAKRYEDPAPTVLVADEPVTEVDSVPA